MDVEHFDEGVYAANLYATETDGKYPYRDLYAPPLFPGMAELGITSLGTPAGAVRVSLLGGILLIPVLWWTAREWFGPAPAILAATLAATSDYHAWFSRAALTDAWLCLWMTAGAYWGWRAMLSGRPLTLLMAGGCAALAWWTKYNGWLTLAVIGGGWLTSWVAGTAAQAARHPTRPAAPSGPLPHRNRRDRRRIVVPGLVRAPGRSAATRRWRRTTPATSSACRDGGDRSFSRRARTPMPPAPDSSRRAGAIVASLWLVEAEPSRRLSRILLVAALGVLLVALGGARHSPGAHRPA